MNDTNIASKQMNDVLQRLGKLERVVARLMANVGQEAMSNTWDNYIVELQAAYAQEGAPGERDTEALIIARRIRAELGESEFRRFIERLEQHDRGLADTIALLSDHEHIVLFDEAQQSERVPRTRWMTD